jgi:hypothetical protein
VLRLHADPLDDQPVDLCAGRGLIWKGVPYQPLKCDINAALPNLDVVGHWRDVARFLGGGRVLTVVGDPLHLSDLGKRRVRNCDMAAADPFTQANVVGQVAELLDAAQHVLDPVRGTMILKLADQINAGTPQLSFRVIRLAESQGWTVCDVHVLNGANMPNSKRLHAHHLPSRAYWLVLHPSPSCPGDHAAVLPLRTRCAHCGRPVAVEKMHTPTYCRPPRGCKQAAYRERRRKSLASSTGRGL